MHSLKQCWAFNHKFSTLLQKKKSEQVSFLIPSHRMLVVIPTCDQQGSHSFNSSTLHPPPPPPQLGQPPVLFLTIGRHCLLPLSMVEKCTTSTWRLVATETQGSCFRGNKLFMVWSDEMASSTSLQLSRSVAHV